MWLAGRWKFAMSWGPINRFDEVRDIHPVGEGSNNHLSDKISLNRYKTVSRWRCIANALFSSDLNGKISLTVIATGSKLTLINLAFIECLNDKISCTGLTKHNGNINVLKRMKVTDLVCDQATKLGQNRSRCSLPNQ